MPRQVVQRIEYGAVPVRASRRWADRAVLAGVIATSIAFAARFGPLAVDQTKLLYWQRAALCYAAPADQVVYTDDPGDIRALTRSRDCMMSSPAGSELIRFAKPWRRFYERFSPPGRQPSGVLFLHELQSHNGNRLMVVLEIHPRSGSGNGLLGLCAATCSPAGALSRPLMRHEKGSSWLSYNLQPGDHHIRFYAGQLDPRDSSHFTVGYTVGRRPGILHGWLSDDNSITLEDQWADGMTTAPAPSSPATLPSADR